MTSTEAQSPLRQWPQEGLHVVHLVTVPESAYLLLGVELDHLVQRGHRVTVVTGPGERLDQLRARHPAVGVEVIPSLTRRMAPRSDLAAARELYGCLRQLRPDVVHTHMPKTGWVGRVVARLARVPLVVNTCHGLYARQLPTRSAQAMGVAIEWVSELFAHQNLFQNHDDLALMHRTAPWRAHTYIGNGIDPDRWQLSPTDRAEARQYFDLDPDVVVVGGVGRLIAHKGIAEFQAVAEQLEGRAQFVWVGPSEPGKATATSFTSPAVRWLGEQSDMRRVYAALDIFVLPSYMEGVPRSAMEAAAAGVPIVLTDIPGSRDLAAEGAAVLVAPRDSAGLARALAVLIVEERRRSEQAARGLALVRRNHDQHHIAEQLELRYRTSASSTFRSPPQGT